VCNGSLGDPVVSITFGQGATGPSPYVPTSSYTYIADPCPNDGYYTITSFTSDCFNDTWHTVTSDHTGNGNFMLVNASYSPGNFFLTSVSNLCPNTTYEFSSWVMNVMNRQAIEPDIVFYIEKPDSTVLASYDTGPIPGTSSPVWKKYGILFTTPADNASIILRMRNNSPGGIGNDLALDDIAFRPCGAQITASIQNNPDTVNICSGNTTVYNLLGDASAVYQRPVYQWQTSNDSGNTWQDITGATQQSYTRPYVTQPNDYFYRFSVTDSNTAAIASCRVASNVVAINVHAIPVVDAGPDRIYIKDYPDTLDASASANGDALYYNWTPPLYMSDPTVLRPIVSPAADIIYTLMVQSAFGCASQDAVSVKVVDGIFIPNAFTPNGDGLNDNWSIPYLDIDFNADVKIFNRWGQLVYHSSSGKVMWDGTFNSIPQPSGAYIYVVTFSNNKFPQMKGTLMLIR
jgi:gliding motility-associated-like protein